MTAQANFMSYITLLSNSKVRTFKNSTYNFRGLSRHQKITFKKIPGLLSTGPNHVKYFQTDQGAQMGPCLAK